ncbi:hypothetical protein MTP04_05090 [Lysinibacillus sp. PLM2]|nr:hypothetical protein MTP04_05090 [Lysinibacillus sp. PLM2]
MGFYYLFLLLVGVVLLLVGGWSLWKGVFLSNKTILLLLIIGLLCVSLAIFLLTPGSSEVIADLLNL